MDGTGADEVEAGMLARLVGGLQIADGPTPADAAAAIADGLRIDGAPTLTSAHPVSALATAAVGAAALAARALLPAGACPAAVVRREVADAWFGMAVSPVGWTVPPPWDPIAGDYRAADGWIRLHTNAPRHRAAARAVLGVDADRDRVADAVSGWRVDDLETAVVDAGGAAAGLRSPDEWRRHPQGAAVAAEPLARIDETEDGRAMPDARDPGRPLAGVRVLDLTRVLAGPVATRLLAGLGATVLRIDPPDWHEPALEAEMTVGKRTARLDAGTAEGAALLRALLADADVLVHGYRPAALAGLGLDDAARSRIRPGLVDVALDAYGWTGPWAGRRGFDSLVQCSSGIAWPGPEPDARPIPLPVQALDHATGYLLAAAALRGIARRRAGGPGSRWRLSLARTAVELAVAGRADPSAIGRAAAVGTAPLPTHWGQATILAAPFELGAATPRWSRPPRPFGTDPPAW